MNWKKLFKYLILFVLFSIIIYYSSMLNVKAASTSVYYFSRQLTSSGIQQSFGPYEIGKTYTNEYSAGTNKARDFTFYLNNLSFSKGYHYVFEFDFITTRFFGDDNILTYLNNSTFSIGGVYSTDYFLHVTETGTNTYHFLMSGQSVQNTNTFAFIFDPDASDLYYTVNFKIDNLSITSTDDNRFASFDIQSSIDGLREEQEKTNEKLDELNDNVTDESSPNTSGLGNAAGWLPAGPIDSLINLPLTLLNAFSTSINETCTPYSLPFFNNTTIQIPCFMDYLLSLDGFSVFITSFDVLIAVLVLYRVLMSLYKDVQKLLSLKDSDANLGGLE